MDSRGNRRLLASRARSSTPAASRTRAARRTRRLTLTVGFRRLVVGTLTCCARRAPSASARSNARSPPAWRCATTAARASARPTSRPRSITSASPAARPTTTSPRPTAASSASWAPSRVVGAREVADDTHEELRAREALDPQDLLPVVAARTPRLPHTHRGTRAPAPSGTRDMITTFTTEVSGESGPGHDTLAGLVAHTAATDPSVSISTS
jgi:hypothetical protein